MGCADHKAGAVYVADTERAGVLPGNKPYKEFVLGKAQASGLPWLPETREHLDAYCIRCEQDSVFQGNPQKKTDAKSGFLQADASLKDGTFALEFACTRDFKHSLCFIFQVADGKIAKIGQWPTIADLQKTGVKKYKKVLGEDRLGEFTKAIGLNAHGVGIGAFVYLRRIFEFLISQANKVAQKAAGWDQQAYDRGRMDDKILALKDHLPQFLVENRRVYSILSLGLHELGEGECKQYFGPVKTAIELILDEKLAQIEREEKMAESRRQIAAITEEVMAKGKRE